MDSFARLPAEVRGLLRPAPHPDWLEPMLATLTDHAFSDPAWVYERKLDGQRVLAFRNGPDVRLFSRNQKRIDGTYPEILEALAAQSTEDFVLDGEVVAFNSGGNTSFSRLQQRLKITDPVRARQTRIGVYYYVFDLMHLDGHDIRALPLRARKRLLADALTLRSPLRSSPHRNGSGETYFAEASTKGWEGVMAKRGDGPYVAGRSKDWLKIKHSVGQELVVGGFTDPQRTREGFGALLVGYYDPQGRLQYAGKVGTGYSPSVLTELRQRLDEMETPESPFATRVAEPRVHWVRPELVAEIAFTEWTGDGKLRHPSFKGLRTDKAARDVVRESPAGSTHG